MLHNFMLTSLTFHILLTFVVDSKSARRQNYVKFDDDDEVEETEENRGSGPQGLKSPYDISASDYDISPLAGDRKNCWITLNARQHHETMDQLDETYKDARQDFEDNIAPTKFEFDSKLLKDILNTRGRLSGRLTDMNKIPAGLNLGGYCMMRMNKSVLFFHRMKLRNNTRFRINYLHTDLRKMQIAAELSLNDLHLFGSYERAVTEEDPSVLLYRPTYGQVEILLRNVEYKMEGRLRLLEDSLYIVVVNSEINFYDSLMLYKNGAKEDCTATIKPSKKHIDQFIERMKSDLDEWLRDYFNEHLVFFPLGSAASIPFREYEKKKTIELNKYVEDAIKFLKGKLHQVNASNVILPSFDIFSVNGMELKLQDGVLRGLDTMYRRSVATCKKDNDVRVVDALLGFSSLKVIYKYMVYVTTGLPPLSGLLVLSADELTTHMTMSLLKDPETADLNFDFIQQLKPESLTVEGSANRMIANFKHVLEFHVIAIMTNTLYHNIRALRTLTNCHPDLFGYADPEDLFYKSVDDKHESSTGKKSYRDPDYVVKKEDSIEVELPPNEKGESKKVHLAHVESLNITKLNKK